MANGAFRHVDKQIPPALDRLGAVRARAGRRGLIEETHEIRESHDITGARDGGSDVEICGVLWGWRDQATRWDLGRRISALVREKLVRDSHFHVVGLSREHQ